MSKVKIENLQKELDNVLVEFGEKIDEYVETGTDENIKAAKNELRIKSPKADKPVSIGVDKVQMPGTYQNSWYIVSKKNSHLYTKVIANRVYQLTHLLEFGHTLRNGKRWKGKPHIRETERAYREKFVEGLEENIRKGM